MLLPACILAALFSAACILVALLIADTATVLVLTPVVLSVAVGSRSLLFGTLEAADWSNLAVQV